MADLPSNSSSTAALAGPTEPRRAGSGRFTTTLAVLGLAAGAYALLRLDGARDRLDEVRETVTRLEADRNVLRNELANLATREERSRLELQSRLDTLNALPRQMQELDTVVQELRGRAAGPERAWSRAEARFLLELAQHRLTLEHDVGTAIAALEAADLRLSALRDASLAGVRRQIAHDLQLLRAVRMPDIAGITTRLHSAEQQAELIAVKGIVAFRPNEPAPESLPQGMFARAWAVSRNALRGLVTVRRVDDASGTVVTAQEEALRRQHLQLLLFAARTAAVRHDQDSYRASLAAARRALEETFDLNDPRVTALRTEVQLLESIDVDPELPDISASLQQLQRALPASGPG